MAGEMILTAVGNLTADPELRFTPSGAAVVNFTIAQTTRVYDRDTNGWKEGDTVFLRCNAWRQMAENVAESLTKGMRVMATGRVKQRSVERDGQRTTYTELEVDEVAPSLKYATAKVNKVSRSGSSETGGNRSKSDPWSDTGSGGGSGSEDPWASTSDKPPF